MKLPSLLIIVLCCLCSCRSVVRTADNTTHHDSIRSTDLLHDSIHIRDSIILISNADTVRLREVRYLTRYRYRTDTVEKYVTDTVYQTVSVTPGNTSGLFSPFHGNLVPIIITLAIILLIIISLKK